MVVNILGFSFFIMLLGVLVVYAWRLSRKLQPWLKKLGI